MKTKTLKKSPICLSLIYKSLRVIFRAVFTAAFVTVFCFGAFGCKKSKTDLFDNVSELRDNVFIAQCDDVYLQIYSIVRETPYLADGIRRELSRFSEFHITAPAAYNRVDISFEINGKRYGGDTSYDNVKSEYFYSCSVDLSNEKSLPVKLNCGGKELSVNANSVITENTVTPKRALNALYRAEKDKIDGLTDKYGFAGEIRVRLIYEEAPYYYIGIIEKNGRVSAYLMNAENEKILAKRES